MIDSLQKYLAELFGTFTLVFVGTTAIVSTQGDSAFDVTIGLAFGLALLAGLFAFAELSGGHFNPAVSIAMVLDKRLDATDQILGVGNGRYGTISGSGGHLGLAPRSRRDSVMDTW